MNPQISLLLKNSSKMRLRLSNGQDRKGYLASFRTSWNQRETFSLSKDRPGPGRRRWRLSSCKGYRQLASDASRFPLLGSTFPAESLREGFGSIFLGFTKCTTRYRRRSQATTQLRGLPKYECLTLTMSSTKFSP